MVILYAWDCSSVGKMVRLLHSRFSVKCLNDVFVGWVIYSLDSSRVRTVKGLLKLLQSNMLNPTMISSYVPLSCTIS